MKVQTLPTAPGAAGHYSRATLFDNLVFISGQLPDPPTAAFADQVRSTMAKVLGALAEAGGEPSDLLQVTAYIVGVGAWDEFNRVYAEVLGEVKPARTVVPVQELHFGALVEIQAVAARAPA